MDLARGSEGHEVEGRSVGDAPGRGKAGKSRKNKSEMMHSDSSVDGRILGIGDLTFVDRISMTGTRSGGAGSSLHIDEASSACSVILSPSNGDTID